MTKRARIPRSVVAPDQPDRSARPGAASAASPVTRARGRGGPVTVYEISVSGDVDVQSLEALGMTVTQPGGVTVLRGPVRDAAALHGLLSRLRASGVDLIEVRRWSTPPSVAGVEEAP